VIDVRTRIPTPKNAFRQLHPLCGFVNLFMARRPVDDITFTLFKDESQLEDIIKLIQNDLSEPYSIYVYRYFLHQWYLHFPFPLTDGF